MNAPNKYTKFEADKFVSILKYINHTQHDFKNYGSLYFEEYVWLKLKSKLQTFNISEPIIQKVKSHLLTQHSKEFFQAFAILSNDKTYEELYQFQLSPLKDFIIKVFTVKTDLSLWISETGIVLPFIANEMQELLKLDIYNDISKSSFITISISEIINDHFGITSSDFSLSNHQLLTSKESSLLELLNEEKVTSAEIKLKSGELDLIRITQKIEVDSRSRISHNIRNKGYERLTINSREGKALHSERTTSYRL